MRAGVTYLGSVAAVMVSVEEDANRAGLEMTMVVRWSVDHDIDGVLGVRVDPRRNLHVRQSMSRWSRDHEKPKKGGKGKGLPSRGARACNNGDCCHETGSCGSYCQ
jgi:hypothetical protein